ncbi:hypothetical protein [Vibrio mediterranei]|uniref:hypothetical protein n=1 Tax=Vibrio mediterranei TaxID=689 RepID=UPI00148E2BED|nr:hypothetical protein [Vibrio mediterranei]NOI26735.1 hypothetical protein [Vibrio mediterranei]
MPLHTTDEWICLDDGEEDYVIERVEFRVKGKKPLVLNNPSFSKLFYNVQQYLHINRTQAKAVLQAAIIDVPDPLTASEHLRLVQALSKSYPLDMHSNGG